MVKSTSVARPPRELWSRRRELSGPRCSFAVQRNLTATVDRPSQLDSVGLRKYVAALKVRGAETAALSVALEHKYASPFTVLVMALIGMPLAIEFGRKSTVIALCSAVVVSLAFWLISSGFQQLGEHSLLPPPAAVWTPIVMFACGGLYFISRVRT